MQEHNITLQEHGIHIYHTLFVSLFISYVIWRKLLWGKST